MFNVILPTYNEARNIVPLLFMLREVFFRMNKEALFVVVDDNSPDGTSKTVKNLDMPGVIVLDRPSKLGLGTAYAYAIKYCKYPYTIIMDTDLQHDPYSVSSMYAVLTGTHCDIITGTRYAAGGTVCGWSFFRKLVSATANNIARYVLGLKTSDLTGSFRIYKTDVLEKIISQVRCQGFGFQMEMIARAERLGCEIREFPIVFYDRDSGDSKMTVGEIRSFLKAVTVLYCTL